MFLRLFLLVSLFSVATAQSLQITEIAPHTLDHQPEWFEFKIDGFDTEAIESWKISNGEGKPKLFSDHAEKLHLGEDESYFYFSPSPLALSNSGGTIQILDAEENILNEVTYPEAKSRSTKSYQQREVWNWDPALQQLTPQLIRAPNTSGYQHSRGMVNKTLPTLPNLFTAIINEVSPDNSDTDFIEIFIVDGPDQINLQYTQIKHNGTVLWHFADTFLVKPGDYLVFKVGTPDNGLSGKNTFHTNARDGLSGGSGTIEIITMANTSLEQRMDTLCWQNKKLSETEQKRVDKFIQNNDWQNQCVEIEDLVENESMARKNQQDSNESDDFWRHFNGSIGTQNIAQNQPPVAHITIQGSGKTVGVAPFFLNLNAENSTDPDGSHDLSFYEWRLGEEVISNEKNPAGFYVEKIGAFTLTLTVTDQSGAAGHTSQLIIATNQDRDSTTSGSEQAKKVAVQQLIKNTFTINKKEQETGFDSFLTAYLARSDWTEKIMETASKHPLYPNYEKIKEPLPIKPLYNQNWNRHINLPQPVRQRVKKNLGILFSWRESPWPDLAAEWTAVVKHDQTFECFAGVYLGF